MSDPAASSGSEYSVVSKKACMSGCSFKYSAVATSPYEGYGYNCPLNALVLNNTAAGNMNSPQYQLYFQECNSTGGGLTGSVFGYNTWQSGWPSASYDMKTWPH